MLNNDTITCSSCASEWDGNAQCPCWMNGLDDVMDPAPLPTQDTLSWHHLSKEQVTKGIIMQLGEGHLPLDISILIWKEPRRSLKADEESARSYYGAGIIRITGSPTLRPNGRGLEWQIKTSQHLNGGTIRYGQQRRNPNKRLLEIISMIGQKEFIYEEQVDETSCEGEVWVPASLKSRLRYFRENHYDTITSDFDAFQEHDEAVGLLPRCSG